MAYSSSFKALLLGAACLSMPLSPAVAQPASAASATTAPKRNVVIFIADGLRYGIVNKDTAPTLFNLKRNGVDFRNSHSLYPTVTTANASVIATGHGIGDTGEWGNTLFLGWPEIKAGDGNALTGMENDSVLKETEERFSGNYLNEVSFLNLARQNGYRTAAIGKEGPVLIQDITAADGKGTIIIDDATHSAAKGRAVPLDPAIDAAIQAAGLSLAPTPRGANGERGDATKPGTTSANLSQQAWFRDVATKVILPDFVRSGQPFALLYWSRDPDGSQHNNGDGLNQLTPGINGETSLAGVRNASDNLQALIEALKAQGVYDNTDIFVTADHGFSTIGLESKTSYAATFDYSPNRMPGLLPEGFLSIDLSHALGLPLHDNKGKPYAPGNQRLSWGSRIGTDPVHPDIMSVSSGGSEIIYLDAGKAKTLAPRIVDFLTHQDYVAAIFVDDGLGRFAGALPMSAVGLEGSARTPKPSIYVSYRDYALPSCVAKWKNPELCSILVTNSELQQGQGNHGALTRANTRNFMAAIGPDFKAGYVDWAPISNADITPTLARILGFDLDAPAKGQLRGRAITEALRDGPATIQARVKVQRSARAANGFVTVMETQVIGDHVYLDAAGMPGRVVGLKSKK